METTQIKKGDKFLCIKEKIGICIRGKHYYSEMNGSISLEMNTSTSRENFIKEHLKLVHDEESE